VRNRERAEEIDPEIFEAAAGRLPGRRQGDPPALAWLYTVARRRFAAEARRLGRLPKLDPQGSERASLDYGPFVAMAVRDGLAQLPGGQTQVVVLKLLRGLTFAEVGTEVGLTEAETRTRFTRALEALRGELAEMAVEP
jgi:DNA-directed RNA polymerase specialized sigma24 family protein